MAASFTIDWALTDDTASTGIRVRYRLKGTADWTNHSPDLASSETEVTITGLLENRIYEFQVENILTADPTYSSIVRGIKITGLDADTSATDTSVTVSFDSLGVDFTAYILKIKENGSITILETKTIAAGDPVISYTFLDLSDNTDYTVDIIAVAAEFSETFSFDQTTDESSSCPAPTGVTAELIIT